MSIWSTYIFVTLIILPKICCDGCCCFSRKEEAVHFLVWFGLVWFGLVSLGLVSLGLVFWEIGLKATYMFIRSWVSNWAKLDNDTHIPKVCAKCWYFFSSEKMLLKLERSDVLCAFCFLVAFSKQDGIEYVATFL